MKSLLDLSNYFKELPHKLEESASELAIETARKVHADLLTVTPVDTSQALSNWVLTVGEPWAVALPAHFEGAHGSTQSDSINAALQAGEQQLALKQPGEPIFISNNAPYIRNLNDGSSKQAPAGFVERAVLFGRKTAESVGIKIKS